jgi:hypothetical protein
MPVTPGSLKEHALHLGVPEEAIEEATKGGIPIAVLMQLIVTYGLPAVMLLLSQLFGVKLPPLPVPPAPPLPVALTRKP